MRVTVALRGGRKTARAAIGNEPKQDSPIAAVLEMCEGIRQIEVCATNPGPQRQFVVVGAGSTGSEDLNNGVDSAVFPKLL